ncbi:MAG: ABC transporter permease [Bacteroidales bacterium]|nr:MAG: ABC transporter permease [Bacteroidales bacterium]
MFHNYLKITLRNLANNKLFSFINIFGLSVGIACTFLIVLNIQDELSYDRFFKDGNRIYRVSLNRIYPDNQIGYAIIPSSIGEAMENDFPEVESCTRLFTQDQEIIFRYGENIFREKYFILADSNFFDFFHYPLIKGDSKEVLKTPNGLVLTESMALKYFGSTDVIDSTLTTAFGEFLVTGICEDLPYNTHFRFDFIGPLSRTGLLNVQDYISFSVKTYLKLREDTNPDNLEAKFPELVRKYAAGQIESRMGVTFDDYTAAGNGYHYYLTPLKDIHLHSHLENEIKPNGNIIYVYIFISIAIFLLIIACINFMNLSTARYADRAREVGMRKILGGQKKQLVWQFLGESLAVTFSSMLLSVVLTELMLPAFNNLAGKTLIISYFGNWFTIPVLAGLTLFVGFFAGSYPSFYLSTVQPIQFMRGKFSTSRGGIFMRNLLVIFQFGVSITLIAVTLLVSRQMKYFFNKDLGFERENIVLLERAGFLGENMDAFKQELMKYPGIESVASSNTLISGGYYFGMFFQVDNLTSEILTSRGMVIDYDYIPTLGLHLIEGRGFSKIYNDSLSIILNESAVKEFGLKDPVGSKLYLNNEPNGTALMTVVGVVQDFHYNSLHQDIKSFVLFSNTGPFGGFGILNIRIGKENQHQTIKHIEQRWEEFIPDQPVSYTFLDDRLGNMYNNEKTSGKVFGVFSLLAIIIAGVGLFGLAAFVARKRTKEIGIRKVMGSSINRVALLLSVSFAKLVGIAFVVATPIAFIAIKKWLQNFAYRTPVSIWIFILAGLMALLVALFTISFHTVKVANSNPADSLRYE